MYVSVSYLQRTKMDQPDIKYIMELLNDAILEKDWDKIEEVCETLKEFLDTDLPNEEE
jgi:hypothetical protein